MVVCQGSEKCGVSNASTKVQVSPMMLVLAKAVGARCKA